MFGIGNWLSRLAWLSGPPAAPVNDNASDDEPRYEIDDDPYWVESERQHDLALSAQLVSATDGNPAAVLNMISVGRRHAA
jgi:hypothetical protein